MSSVPSHSSPLIFTDLDGTLLAHEDYRFDAVAAFLPAISPRIPVILSTSKTLPEVGTWREALNLLDPFMIENGSAVFMEAGSFPCEIEFEGRLLKGESDRDFIRYILGTGIEELMEVLQPFRQDVVDLITCSLDEAQKLTGLTRQEALAAQQRAFTVPMIIADPAVGEAIRAAAKERGLRCLQGGRFMHLQGACDKGQALRLLRTIMEKREEIPHHAIAAGDSENDREMLRSADVAIIVSNPAGAPFELDHPNIIRTQAPAPEGWVEGVTAALRLTGDTNG